jgi:GR25 family glycosyltransferase involved in LPS biosynthesis
MYNVQYYLIHGGDPTRRDRMNVEFEKWSFDASSIIWVTHPNKNELSDKLIDTVVTKSFRDYNGNSINTLAKKGEIACTYKHYMCLKDIVENNCDYGVIIEDNIFFTEDYPLNVPKYIEQATNTYGEWDIIFNHYDNYWGVYDYTPIKPNLSIYPKSNDINYRCHGGTKSANCYLLTNACAKKLYDAYLPFYQAPDSHMNHKFRQLGIKSFWVEPSYVFFEENHVSTTQQ